MKNYFLPMQFPFLIGKVLTARRFMQQQQQYKFPFLIGKVLTIDNTTKQARVDFPIEFPFLIGKVLTSYGVAWKLADSKGFHSL